MKSFVSIVLASLALPALAAEAARPKAGPVSIMKMDEVKPGLKATAWTVFTGDEPEPVPGEIIGVMKNVWGPRQDIILGKLGGKAQRTMGAAGMSRSPLQYEGQPIGAVSLRLRSFA